MFVVDGFEVLLPENREAKRAMRGPLLLAVETEDSASDARLGIAVDRPPTVVCAFFLNLELPPTSLLAP